MTFCQSQHTTGLVTFDTEEKFLDLVFIVGPDGENAYKSHTALYNPNRSGCQTPAECDYILVRLIHLFKCEMLVQYATFAQGLKENMPP